MSPPLTHLLWCDLETTGIDENLDPIMEIAVILTTPDLQVAVPGFEYSWAISMTDKARRQLAKNKFVRDMHTVNGLTEVCQDPNRSVKIESVDRFLSGWLMEDGIDAGRVALAGSGVAHFDMRFIRRQMPNLASMLRYRPIDIGQISSFALDVCGFQPPDFRTDKTHRSMDDVRLHLAEARWWRQNLMGLFERIHQ